MDTYALPRTLMALDAKSLYQELILDHGKHPRNQGPHPEASHEGTAHNPLCGDRVTVRLRTDEAGRVTARFEGRGCLISLASASLLTEAVAGRTTEEALGLSGDVEALVGPGEAPGELGALEALRGAREFPGRRACVTLAWQALRKALGDLPAAEKKG